MASPVLLPTPAARGQGVPLPGDDMGQNGRSTAVSPLPEGQTVGAANEANTAVLPDTTESLAVGGAAVVLPDLLAALPPHLGWGSTAVTTHLRQTHAAPDSLDETAVAPTHSTNAELAPGLAPHATFPLPPSLALAFLRQGRVAEGRLWLLLRWLDSDGRGWLERAAIFAACTDKASPTYLCTPRYLRQLLAAGDGLFWQQDSATGKACPELAERVWLRGQAKVAAGLGVWRLDGRTVAMPSAILLAPIGQVRAHLYASFHSGRGETAAPISRETLRDLSGASPRAQQGYERRARVQAQGCVAVGAAVTAVSDPQEHAWQHGRAAFTFTDQAGRYGRAGGVYQARRLPNRYVGPHALGKKPRRLNARLAVLCQQGDAGNGHSGNGRSRNGRSGNGRSGNGQRGARRYYPDGAAAARGWSRAGGRTWAYWPGRSQGQRRSQGLRGGVFVWHELPPCVQ